MLKVCLFSSWMTTQEPSAEDSPFVVPPVLQITITIVQSQIIVISLLAYLHSRKQRPQFEGHHEFKGSSGSIWGPTVQVGGGAKGASTIWLHFIRISLIMTLENDPTGNSPEIHNILSEKSYYEMPPSLHFQQRWTWTLSKSRVGLVPSRSHRLLWSCRCTCSLGLILLD